MNTYFLIRHGEDYDNVEGLLNGHRDRPLTAKGIGQAIELAEKIKLANLKFDVFFSSPLNRVYTTASIVASYNNLPTPIVEPLLIERDFGKLSGTPRGDILKNCGDRVYVTPTINYVLDTHGAETFPSMIDRANQLFDKLDKDFQDKNILLASHGDIGKMIFCAYYKLEWKNVLQDFHLGNSEMIKMSPDTDSKNPKVITIDQIYC